MGIGILRGSLKYAMKGSEKRFLTLWFAFFFFCMMITGKDNIGIITFVIALVVGFLVAYVFHERKKKEMKMEVAGYARLLISSDKISEEENIWKKTSLSCLKEKSTIF